MINEAKATETMLCEGTLEHSMAPTIASASVDSSDYYAEVKPTLDYAFASGA